MEPIIAPLASTHPGKILKNELQARNFSQKGFASIIGMQPTMLNEIIREKRPITATVAILLEKTLGVPADFWMRLQYQYELDKVRINERTIRKVCQIDAKNQLLNQKSAATNI